MSLVGNLEDLSLPDILQIVSLSRKSGILMLEREGQQGKIIIRQGKVIQTISPRQGRTLGELLTARGLLRPDDLKKALEIQRSGEGRELLGDILVQLRLTDEGKPDKALAEVEAFQKRLAAVKMLDPACGAPRGALWIMPQPTLAKGGTRVSRASSAPQRY